MVVSSTLKTKKACLNWLKDRFRPHANGLRYAMFLENAKIILPFEPYTHQIVYLTASGMRVKTFERYPIFHPSKYISYRALPYNFLLDVINVILTADKTVVTTTSAAEDKSRLDVIQQIHHFIGADDCISFTEHDYDKECEYRLNGAKLLKATPRYAETTKGKVFYHHLTLMSLRHVFRAMQQCCLWNIEQAKKTSGRN